MYGFSIISCIEILYFASGTFFAFRFKNFKQRVQRKLSRISSTVKPQLDNDPPPAYALYWQELKPKQPINMDIFKDEIILNLYKNEKNLQKSA